MLVGCKNVQISFAEILREVYGEKWIVNEKRKIPFVRMEALYDISKKLEGSLRFDYTNGDFNFVDKGLDYHLNGNMQAFGTGLSYFPFCENFSLNVGGEIFRGEADVFGRSFGTKVSGDVLGWGLNVGVTGKIPINERFFIFGSGGYNFTDDLSRGINFDFDGWFVGGGD